MFLRGVYTEGTIGGSPARIDRVFGRRYTSWAVPPGSAVYVVRDGDTLHTLADLFYGDASLWYALADVNPQVFDPLDLPIDTVIRIPPAEFVITSAPSL